MQSVNLKLPILRAFLILALVTLVIFILMSAKDVLLPIVLAIFLWYLINAMADGYRRILPIPYGRPVIAYILSVLTFLFLAWFPIHLASTAVPQVIQSAPKYQVNFTRFLDQLFGQSHFFSMPFVKTTLNQIDLGKILSAVAGSLASFTGHVIMIFLYLIFLLIEQSTFDLKFRALFKQERYAIRARRILNSIYQRIKTYLWVKTLMSILTALISYIVLVILGVDFAEFWAVIIFLLNYIPSIGSVLGVALPALLSLVQFGTFYPFLVIVIILGFTHFFLGNVVEPRLMGQSLNLSPLVILLSLIVWGTIWGIIGAFLSVPLMVMLTIIFAEFSGTKPIAIMLSRAGNVD